MIPDSLRHLGEKLQHGWQHLPLRGLGILSAALPMVAVVFSAAMAFVGNEKRERTETAVTRHFAMVERLGDLLTHLLDAETGLRGHLLTAGGRPEFLAPYDEATRSLPGEIDALRDFTRGEPGENPRREKLARLEAIRATVGTELTLLGQLRAAPDPGTTDREAVAPLLVRSKATMDVLRDQLRTMRGEEQRLLGLRLEEIRRVRHRDYLTIAGALLLGLLTRGAVFYFFNRRVVRRVEALTVNVQALAADRPAPHPPSEHRDAIGELERALAALHPPAAGAGVSSPAESGGSPEPRVVTTR